MFKSLLLVMSGLPYSVFGTDQFLASLMELVVDIQTHGVLTAFPLEQKQSPETALCPFDSPVNVCNC